MGYRYPGSEKEKENAAEKRRRERYEEIQDQFAGSNFNDPNDPAFGGGDNYSRTGNKSTADFGIAGLAGTAGNLTKNKGTGQWETDRSASEIMADIQALLSGEMPDWSPSRSGVSPAEQLKKQLAHLRYELWVSQEMRKSRGTGIGTFKANLGYKLPVVEDEPTSTVESILGVASGNQSSIMPFTTMLREGLF